ncbi:hypothetical protein K474DRAFT_1607852 [Panus rudis PR-1116 ss-1]|nr:hypothetical protein K474DRAFT_1607852 [Panus rudis PR-1116 ss-1]
MASRPNTSGKGLNISAGLWADLLPRNAAPKDNQVGSSSRPHASKTHDSEDSVTRLAPKDCHGTATLVVLKDTKATLEKFSSNVTTLVGSVKDTTVQLSRTAALCERIQEKTADETAALVDRRHKELQTTLGEPAQQTQILDLKKDVSYLSTQVASTKIQLDMLLKVHPNFLEIFKILMYYIR